MMKKVLITGAGTGFGHEVAMRLALKGFDVIAAVEELRGIFNGKQIYYPGAPHGLTATHQEQVNADLFAFLKG
jgi:NAD(P)-dependent dehydrogenase (short-subunit alcohol dehydrogenase family)